MAEMGAIEDNERIEAGGGEPVDLSEMGEWREETDLIVIEALTLYAQYGQTNGFSDALNVGALKDGFEIESIPRDEWPNLTFYSQKIHEVRLHVDAARKQKAKAGILHG